MQKLLPHFLKYRTCLLCGLYTNTDYLCQACIAELPWADTRNQRSIIATFNYEAPVSHFITQLKFHQQLFYARILASLMCQQSHPFANADVLIPVPLHRSRLRQRGFNQSLEIARFLSHKLNIPVDYRNCQRQKATEPQTSLTQSQRKYNLRNAFCSDFNYTQKHIVIIDDVITTGSTIRSLIKSFPNRKENKISVWCVAKR